jgi:CHAP domain
MLGRRTCGGIVLLGSLLVLGLPVTSRSAAATPRHGNGPYFVRAGKLQCVPFARNESGIELVGNAWTWWGSAAGVYQRGQVPEAGAVLAFRSIGAMRFGHVAVVGRVISSRQIEIDHANWGPGSVNRDVAVVDVSEHNDWSAVRVALSHPGEFGNIYPTYGFIYDRPDRGWFVTADNASQPPPVPELNPAPVDFRHATARRRPAERVPEVVTLTYDEAFEEVAEAPTSRHKKRLHTQR